MKTYEEYEAAISKAKTELATLEESYERETDESKISKLEYKISRKEENINRMIDVQDAIVTKELQSEERDKEKPEERGNEEAVCDACGGDLVQIGANDKGVAVFECVKCGELYLDE